MATRSGKNIILCADDYAQNAKISAGIVRLLNKERVNATSCLVNSVHWDEEAKELEPFKQHCFIGLHLNFTMGQPLSYLWREHEGELFVGWSHLMKRLLLKRISVEVIRAEILAQFKMFTQVMQCYPDFIDGHQHVHQALGIGGCLLELSQTHEWPVFMRNTFNGWADYFNGLSFPKPQLLALLGGRSFRNQLIQHQVATNTSFQGMYRFANMKHYRRYFKRFLNKTQHGGLIMCHPGLNDDDKSDPLMKTRYQEYQYFESEDFLQDLAAASCQLLVKPTDH